VDGAMVGAVGVVLVEQVIPPVPLDEPVGVIHPVGGWVEMIERTLVSHHALLAARATDMFSASPCPRSGVRRVPGPAVWLWRRRTANLARATIQLRWSVMASAMLDHVVS